MKVRSLSFAISMIFSSVAMANFCPSGSSYTSGPVVSRADCASSYAAIGSGHCFGNSQKIEPFACLTANGTVTKSGMAKITFKNVEVDCESATVCPIVPPTPLEEPAGPSEISCDAPAVNSEVPTECLPTNPPAPSPETPPVQPPVTPPVTLPSPQPDPELCNVPANTPVPDFCITAPTPE